MGRFFARTMNPEHPSTAEAAPHDPSAPQASPANPAEPSPAEPWPVEGLQAELAQLKARHAEMSDAYLRAKAEAENTRRRAEEDMAKARKFAVEAFAESLLPVADSLSAALALPNATPEQLHEGSQATLRQLTAALEKHRVVAIAPPAGTKFDPHQHQAISVVPSEHEAGTVVSVLQKGYLIAERVLRPALVSVAAPK